MKDCRETKKIIPIGQKKEQPLLQIAAVLTIKQHKNKSFRALCSSNSHLLFNSPGLFPSFSWLLAHLQPAPVKPASLSITHKDYTKHSFMFDCCNSQVTFRHLFWVVLYFVTYKHLCNTNTQKFRCPLPSILHVSFLSTPRNFWSFFVISLPMNVSDPIINLCFLTHG